MKLRSLATALPERGPICVSFASNLASPFYRWVVAFCGQKLFELTRRLPLMILVFVLILWSSICRSSESSHKACFNVMASAM